MRIILVLSFLPLLSCSQDLVEQSTDEHVVCGDGVCSQDDDEEPGDSCPQDCGPIDRVLPDLNDEPLEGFTIYANGQPLMSQHTPQEVCGPLTDTDGEHGWSTGYFLEGSGQAQHLPYWTSTRNCEKTSDPSDYLGHMMRVEVEIKAPGRYHVFSWVPKLHEFCGLEWAHSQELREELYPLRLHGVLVHNDLDPANRRLEAFEYATRGDYLEEGEHRPILQFVRLEPGTHAIYLYDYSPDGAPCQTDRIPADVWQERFFADSLLVRWVTF